MTAPNTGNFTIGAAKPVDPAITDQQIMNADDPQIERTVIRQGNEQTGSQAEARSKMTPEERAKRKALLIQAFDRGVVHDRLTVPLPADMHGEWCRNDPMEIDRLRTLGFEVYQSDGSRRGLHSDGTGALIVADAIFMTTPRENKEVIDEIRMERFMQANGKPGDRKAKTREEKEFEAQALRDSGGIVPVISESSTEGRINREEVKAALDAVDRQTQVQVIPSQ